MPDAELDAFKILGEKGIPFLVELIRKQAFDRRLIPNVHDIFGAMGEEAESAVGPLIEIVANKQNDNRVIDLAVIALGRIGPRAQRAAPALLQAVKDNPAAFQESVTQSFQRMGASQTLPGLLNQLHGQPAVLVIHEIGKPDENEKLKKRFAPST